MTTNAVICEGIGTAIALETGVATLGNMEAVQFHPTGIFPAGILVTEGCRGDGGLLLDVDGHRFMPDYEPEKKELASRDVVSRRMEEHIRKGKGAKSRFGDHLWLDITLLGREAHRGQPARGEGDLPLLPRRRSGQGRIPVRPAQHYTMGGVRTDHTGESPTLKGLFAAGEAACWDMHGFNRLGGNSVAETVVAGMIVGEFIADFCDEPANDVDISTGLVREFLAASRRSSTRLVDGGGTEDATALRVAMQEIMTAKVGIFRNGADLERGRRRAAGTARAQPRHRAAHRRAAPIPSSSPPTACRRCSSWRCASPTARSRAPRAAARISARIFRAATTRSG